MKTNAIFSLALSLAFFLSAPIQTIAQSEKVPYETKEFALNGTATFEAALSGSSVSLVGNDTDKVIVKCYLKKDNTYLSLSSAEAKEFFENVEVKINQSGNRISLTTKQKSDYGWSWKGRPQLSFEVSTPKNVNSEIKTSGGSVALQEVNGSQNLASSGGSISVKSSSGEITSQSSGGSFSVNNFDGNVSVQTSGGSVKVSGMKGQLTAKSSGGGMTLEEISGSIAAYTSGGSISAELIEVKNDLIFQSSGGGISVTVPENIGFDLDVKGGNISSKLANFQGTTTKNQISGKINGGGKSISMQSSGGSIRISNPD